MDQEPNELPDLEIAVENGTHLEVLEALAALAAHELAGNRCPKCQMSTMKMGEISSLMLRLQKLFEEISLIKGDNLGKNGAESPGSPKKRGIRDIKPDRHLKAVGESSPPDTDLPEYGTKGSPRRQGGRKPRSGSS